MWIEKLQVEIAETQGEKKNRHRTNLEHCQSESRWKGATSMGSHTSQLIYHMGLVFRWKLLGSGFQPLPLLSEWIILPSGTFLAGLRLCSEIRQLICLVSTLAGIFRTWVLLWEALGLLWPGFPTT